jgi:PAS domain S-box-containing protein
MSNIETLLIERNKLINNKVKGLRIKVSILLLLITILVYPNINAQNLSTKDSLEFGFAKDTTFSTTYQLNLLVDLIDSFARSNPAKANKYALSAIELAEKLSDTSKVVSLLANYAKNENNQCNYENADIAYHKAKNLVLRSGTKTEKAKIYYIIGSNYYDWSDYSLAQEYYQLSIDENNKLGNKYGVAKSLRGLSAIASNYGDYEQAIGYMQRARNIYIEINDPNSLVLTTLGLGVILKNWGNNDKALSYFQQALNHFKENNNKIQEINLLLHIGDIYIKKEEYSKAIYNFNKALELEKKTPNKKLRSICYSNLGEVYFAIREFDTALIFQKKALVIKYEVGDMQRIVISLLNIGKIYFATNNNKLAEENIKECLKLSVSANLKKTEIEALLILSKINQKNHNYKDSYDYLERYVQLKDKVFDEQSQKMINDLSIKYEATRIEKENELLNQKDAIRSLELKNEKETNYFAITFLIFIIIIAITLIIFISLRTNQTRKNYSILAKKNKEIIIQKEKLGELNKEFAQNKEQFRSIVENATTGMYQTLPSGEIKFANLSLIKMLGYNNFNDLENINLNKEKKHRNVFLRLLEEQLVISGREDIWIRQDNSSMYVNESAWVVKDDNGNIIHYEGIVEDISKRKEAEFALKRSQKELQRINAILKDKNNELEITKDEAIAANEIKSLFIANVSHEIRTPMNSIVGFSTLLSNTITDKQQLSHVNAISSSSKNLLAIINDLLDMSKIQADEIDIIYEPVSFLSLIEGVKQVFNLRFSNKNLQFIVKISNDFPSHIFLDNVRIRQVLLNIIGNAIKFTEKGNIILNISSKQNNIKEIDLSISISDTGIGIQKEEQKTIFEAFKQGKINTKNQESGTGLGLSISNRLIKLMGGNMTLESMPGMGSKFTILIPNVKIALGKTDVSPRNIIDIESITSKIIGNDEILINQDIPIVDTNIQEQLNTKFKDRWSLLINNHIVNDTVLFTNELHSFAIQNNNSKLAKYCEALLFSLQNFEVDNINKLMLDLGQIFIINKPK